jgi:hypothetical protein
MGIEPGGDKFPELVKNYWTGQQHPTDQGQF